MTRKEMWQEFVNAGEWGLKDEFMKLSDEQIASMSVDECVLKCYGMLFGYNW